MWPVTTSTGWSHAEDKIEPRQRGWGGCRYAHTHHCCQNIWEIDCWMYQHCHKRFASNNSRSWCPWLPVPGRCQELLPSTVWSHKMIWHGVRNWYQLCSIVEQMIFLMSSNNSRSRCPCPRQPPDDLTWGSVVFWSRWFEQMCHFTFLAWNKENKHGGMESQSTKTKIKSVSRLSFN